MAPVLYDKKPELGDLIEIDRGSYQHWAVYVGDGFVVHLAPLCGGKSSSMSSVKSGRATVKREKLGDVVGNKCVIKNGLDEEYEPRPRDVIVREACALVGQVREYCVLTNNCEHFVKDLRYGKAESRQVRKAGKILQKCLVL